MTVADTFAPTREELADVLRYAISDGISNCERIIRENRFPTSARDARANLPAYRRLHEQVLSAVYPNIGPPVIEVGKDELVVDRFAGEHRFLSNFSRHTTVYAGVVYPSVEHAFQAAKSLDPGMRARIRDLRTPGEAKRAGGPRGIVELRPGWDEMRVGVMRDLVARKFETRDMAHRLLATGGAYLIEGNAHGDSTWGAVRDRHFEGRPWRGWNQLGRILMDVRRQLRAEWTSSGG